MQPFFSVVIPAYNCAHLISATLDSVLAQEFRDFEIIVVNDGSTDSTVDVLESYATIFKDKIRVIHQENKGEGGGRNSGIFASRGMYIAFLDQDDLWFPWTLQTYHDVLCEHGYPAILIATGQEFREIEDVKSIARQAVEVISYDNFFSAAEKKYLPAGTPGTIVKASVAKDVGGLSEDRVVGIDMEFFWKIGVAKGVCHLVSPTTVAIRRHGGNLQRNVDMAVNGVLLFVEKELNGKYPGDGKFALARRSIISRMARTVSVKAVRCGLFSEGMAIYWQTFNWNYRLSRFKYLLAFPLIYALCKVGVRR